MRDRVHDLVERLRAAKLRIGVGEIVDAMEAVAILGIERETLREGLAATLVKDHAQRERFDEIFDECFPSIGPPRGRERGESARGGGAGEPRQSGGPPQQASGRSERSTPEPESEGASRKARSERREEAENPTAREDSRKEARSPDAREESPKEAGSPDAREGRALETGSEGDASSRQAAARLGRERELLTRPLRLLDAREVPEIRELAERLARRFERRWSRRERRARRGRVDLRRTLRAALAHGGVPVELARRAKRPSRPDLLALVDVSWSTKTAAELLLAMLAPCAKFFRRVTLLAYVGDCAEISFEGGHVIPHAPLDLDARSDLGRVLVRLEGRDISRREVLLILGDARNNRLPARADALRSLARRARAVVWLNPDPPERWNEGDSDIAAYAPHVDLLLGADTLASLARGLDRAARHAAGRGRARRAGARGGLGRLSRLGMMAPAGRSPGRKR